MFPYDILNKINVITKFKWFISVGGFKNKKTVYSVKKSALKNCLFFKFSYCLFLKLQNSFKSFCFLCAFLVNLNLFIIISVQILIINVTFLKDNSKVIRIFNDAPSAYISALASIYNLQYFIIFSNLIMVILINEISMNIECNKYGAW